MIRTGFLLIFLVIVIVIISNGYSKGSTTSAEWKTYQQQ
jgi:hypothetical protein